MTENRSSKLVALVLGTVLLITTAACTEPPSVPAASPDTAEATTSPEELGTEPAPTEPDLYIIDPRTGAAEALLRAPGVQTNAEFSPDGKRVVYESESGGTSQIFVLKANETTQQLTRGKPGAHDPTWSPDGSQIAFTSKPRKGADADIFVMDADGSHILRLVGTARNDGHPDWSPDGSRIAFHTRHRDPANGLPTGLIWLVSVRTRALTSLTRSDGPYAAVDPAWSPDGRWVAYSMFERSTINGRILRSEPWLMRSNGTHKRRIGGHAEANEFSENPTWSPDGRWIVFQNHPEPLQVINVKKERLRTLPDIVDDEQPSWSPRGILVTLSSASATTVGAPEYRWKTLPLADLARGTHFVNVRTGKAVPLPDSLTSIRGAGSYDVSPDGTMILFDNSSLWAPSDEPVERGLHQLWVANIDGSDVRQLTHDPLGASQGSWSPDGTRVVYLGGWARLCCWRSPADLMVLDIATGTTTRVATGRAKSFLDPFFNADGSAILFATYGPHPGTYLEDQPQADLWTIPLSGGRPELLLKDRGYGSYSPDHTKILFTRIVYWQEGNAGGSYGEIWISDADGRHARRLVRSGEARWSPNGRWISWGSRGGLHILNMTTGRSVFVSAGSAQDWVDNRTLIVVKR